MGCGEGAVSVPCDAIAVLAQLVFTIRNEELSRILNRVVDAGIRGGLMELKDTPLRLREDPIPDSERSS